MEQQEFDRRRAKREYRQQADVGGIFRYVDTMTGWQSEVSATPSLAGKHNFLRFAKVSGDCGDSAVSEYWRKHGGAHIEIVELEQLKRGPNQSPAEFRADLETLLELWKDRDLSRMRAMANGTIMDNGRGCNGSEPQQSETGKQGE